MESSYYRKEMEDYVSVVDVYDSAALIGKDFEYLIEQYGVETVTDLMPKVIRVLEQLEYLAGKNEKENDELLQLEATVKRLNSEKEERTKERRRYEQELEQIEESYRKETKDLCQMVSNLQEQNKRLQSSLSDNSSGQEAAVEKTEEDFNVIQTLKEQLTKQKDRIKGLQREVKEKDSEVDKIQNQIEKLTHDNRVLRNSSKSYKTETERLLSEHELLKNTLQDKDRQIISIRDQISLHEKTPHGDEVDAMELEVTQLANKVRDTKMMTNIKTMQAKHLIDEKSELQSLLQDRDQQLRIIQDKYQSEGGSSSNIIGQVVGNVRDADNPRFTLNELKDVLTERNTLKSKLLEIEEELSYYKTKSSEAESPNSSNWLAEEQASGLEDSFTGDVQGPINKEPWDKIHPRPESGIRKFFERFPVELPDTIRVNLVPGELASYAQAKASSFWDLRMTRSSTDVAANPGGRTERPKSDFLSSNTSTT